METKSTLLLFRNSKNVFEEDKLFRNANKNSLMMTPDLIHYYLKREIGQMKVEYV